MALCVLLSNFSSFFATSRFRSLDSEIQCQDNVGSTIIFVHTKIFCTVQVGKRSYQSGFLGARLAKSWGKKRAQCSNYNYYYASLTKEILNGQKGVLTTSSMMGSGLAASNWSFTLSSTANRVFIVTYSVQWYVLIAVGVCEKYSCAMTFLEAKWWQYDMMMIFFPKGGLWLKSSYLTQVWLWAPASPSALHPLECNSSVSALWGQKYRVIEEGSRQCSLLLRPDSCERPGGGSACKYIPPEIKEHKRPSANPTQLHV